MAERRMRLKRGKAGDTGVQVAPALPPEGPNSGERSPWNEKVVEDIVAMVSDSEWSEDGLESIRRAIRLTMATQSMMQVMHPPVVFTPSPIVPPPPAPPPARTIGGRPDPRPSQARMPGADRPIGAAIPFASVHSINVSISQPTQDVTNMNGTHMRVVTGSAEVTVEVRGGGDPVTMLRQAADRFHDHNLTSISTRNF